MCWLGIYRSGSIITSLKALAALTYSVIRYESGMPLHTHKECEAPLKIRQSLTPVTDSWGGRRRACLMQS